MPSPEPPAPDTDTNTDPNAARRAWCDAFERLMADEAGRRSAELSRLIDSLGSNPPDAPAAATSPKRTLPRPIHIWQPVDREGRQWFVRPQPGPLGDHYACRLEIPAAKAAGVRRICLFGESAAAGYLYAPHATPALVLQAQLRSMSGADSDEVIDLARTNETLASLLDAVDAAMQLQPDVLVLYAGNNWNLLETPECSPYWPTDAARRDFARALREGGVAGLADWSARRVLVRASSALEAIATIAQQHGVALIVVVPEVNLADWENAQPTPWLPGQDTLRWHQHYRSARDLLHEDDAKQIREHAVAMLRLDGWSGASACRLLAIARQQEGNSTGAIDAARAEVDNSLYATQATLGAPQAGSMVQSLLRAFATRHGFMLVDLPRIFGARLDGALPDRRLFLDYCHLTFDGMQLAMAGVCARILGLPGAPHPEDAWRDVMARAVVDDPGPQAHATACLGAAMHTAHRMNAVRPPGELLEYWCERALDASTDVLPIARALATLRSATLPEVMTRLGLQNQGLACPLSPQHGWIHAHADTHLLDAIDAVLRRRGMTGVEVPPDPLHEQDLELTGARHLGNPLDRFYPDLMPESRSGTKAYLRYAWPDSVFCVRLDAMPALRLRLTARAPDQLADQAGELVVEINGKQCATLTIGTSWTRHCLDLDAGAFVAGVNRITLRWPDPAIDGSHALQRACDRLERGREADIHPVFGELASLRLGRR